MEKTEKNRFDVIVAGAGMAGLGTALALAVLKRKVLVVTRKGMKGESSPAAGGILDPLLEMNPGSFFLPFCLRAFRDWPAALRQLEKKTGLKIGYQTSGMLYGALSQKEAEILAERYRWQKSLGIKTQWLTRTEILKKEPLLSPEVLSGLFYPEIGRVQPRRLLKVLFEAARKSGIQFCFSSELPQIKTKNGKVAGVQTGKKFYEAPTVVNATGSWAGIRQGLGPAAPVKPAR